MLTLLSLRADLPSVSLTGITPFLKYFKSSSEQGGKLHVPISCLCPIHIFKAGLLPLSCQPKHCLFTPSWHPQRPSPQTHLCVKPDREPELLIPAALTSSRSDRGELHPRRRGRRKWDFQCGEGRGTKDPGWHGCATLEGARGNGRERELSPWWYCTGCPPSAPLSLGWVKIARAGERQFP